MLEIHGISVLVTHRTVSELGSSLDKHCGKYLWDGLDRLPRPGHFSAFVCHCVLTVRVGDPGGVTAHGCPVLSRRQLFAPTLPGISSKEVTAWLAFSGDGQEELGDAAILGCHCGGGA